MLALKILHERVFTIVSILHPKHAEHRQRSFNGFPEINQEGQDRDETFNFFNSLELYNKTKHVCSEYRELKTVNEMSGMMRECT